MALPSLTECAAAFDHLAPALLITAAGSVLVLGLAGLATVVMRRASAAARHEVWLLGFAGTLLLPLLSAAVPGWRVLPRGEANRHAPTAAPAVAIPTDAPSAQPLSYPPSTSTPHLETIMNAKSELRSAGSPDIVAMMPAATPRSDAPVSSSPVPQISQAKPSVNLPRTIWLGWCWFMGTVLVLGRVLLGHLSLGSLRRRCATVPRGELFHLLNRLRRELGLRRSVELLSSPVRTMPMTWGVWRARLLLPEQAASWPPGQRRDVLLHELGHVRRWDCLTQLLSQVACALYWFNPLAWIASHRMQIERERACDDLVLSRGAEPAAYARHLLESVSSVPAFRLAGAAVAMARPSTLEERMRAILDARLSRRALTARGSLATILLLLTALVPVAMLKAQQAPPDEPPTSPRPTPVAPEARETAPGGLPATRPAGPTRSARTIAPAARGGFGGGFGGGGFGGGFSGAGPAAPTLGQGPTCTLDATIYDVRLPQDQIGRLDVAALAKASESADAFEKALAALGTAKPIYRADQSVRLSGDMITISTQVPMVTNSRVADTGRAINSITYRSMGAMFRIAGKAGAPGGVDLDLSIDLAAPSNEGVAIANDVKAPVFRNVTLSHKGPVQPDQPFVVLSVDAGSVDKDGKAVAYIARVTLGEPQPRSAK